MLVLSRRIDQKIYLKIEGRADITIVVTDISTRGSRPQVKIGFDAPWDVIIERDNAKGHSIRKRNPK